MRRCTTISVGILAVTCAAATLASCGGGNEQAAAEFTKLYEKRKDARIRVTYELRDAGGAVDDTWTISQDGADRVAYIGTDTKTVVAGDRATRCERLDTDAPECTPSVLSSETVKGFLGAFARGFFGFDEVLSQAGARYGDVSSGTIAARSARCVKVTLGDALDGLDDSRIGDLGWQGCVDRKTGFLLEAKVLSGEPDDKTDLVAVEVGEPRDEDFTVPAGTDE
jgi:hypothetical protein